MYEENFLCEYINFFEQLQLLNYPAFKIFKLNDSNITNHDAHTQMVCNSFSGTTFNDYMELYMKMGILMLVDFLENSLETSRKTSVLDSLLVMFTKCKLNVLQDVESWQQICAQ